MSGHAGLRALLRGLLSMPRRYRPSCAPSSMTAQERGVWAERIERATLVQAIGAGVESAGCDFWTEEDVA